MTRFTGKATAITPNRELQPDEYFNETDHLIYCSKCNTPRQCRHELQGKVLIPSIRCKCQQEIFEQEEAQRKLHEKQMEIEHLKTSGLQRMEGIRTFPCNSCLHCLGVLHLEQ